MESSKLWPVFHLYRYIEEMSITHEKSNLLLPAVETSLFDSAAFASGSRAWVDVPGEGTVATVGLTVSLLIKFVDAAIKTKRKVATPIQFHEIIYVEQARTVSDEAVVVSGWMCSRASNIRLASFRKNRRCHCSALDANRKRQMGQYPSHRLLTITWMVLLWRNGQARSWQLPWIQAGQMTFVAKAKGLCRYAHAEPYGRDIRLGK